MTNIPEELQKASGKLTESAAGVMRFAPSARERYFAGSGLPIPPPTDEDIIAAIRKALAPAFGHGRLENPHCQICLLAAARAVRALFPTEISPNTSKDTE